MKLSSCLLVCALAAPMLQAFPVPAARGEQLLAQGALAPRTSLSTSEASQAADSLLTALQTRNAQALFERLSTPLKNATTVEAVQGRLNNAHRIKSTRVVAIYPGIDDTTVDVIAQTEEGSKELLLVLDDEGKLVAWKWLGETLPIETTALKFVRDLDAKRWIAARYYLSLDFQKEISPEDLERKWSKLSRILGGVKRVKNAVVSSRGDEQQLVLVTIEFGTVTDNLFVIFDSRGRIINVDFSEDLV